MRLTFDGIIHLSRSHLNLTCLQIWCFGGAHWEQFGARHTCTERRARARPSNCLLYISIGFTPRPPNRAAWIRHPLLPPKKIPPPRLGFASVQGRARLRDSQRWAQQCSQAPSIYCVGYAAGSPVAHHRLSQYQLRVSCGLALYIALGRIPQHDQISSHLGC